jgi:Zn-dependent peptidase ImmA (M78 family)/transcriptional regulator with XRE-family HTH domain
MQEKLRIARQAAGMSTRKVAEVLSPRYPVSHATIANYERGVTRPSLELLSALATLYERPVNWFLDRGVTIENIRYRNLPSKVRVRDRHLFEGEVLRWVTAYVTLEQHLGKPLSAECKYTLETIPSAPADLARTVREELGVGYDQPIQSVVGVLHDFGVRVLEQPTGLRIDGLAARFGTEHIVVLNPSMSNDRCRLNAAHELGHVLFGDCDTEPSAAYRKKEEDKAFAFASHLLMPTAALNEAFAGQSMVRLVKAKEKYGISLAAMVYRAEQQKVVSKKVAKNLWFEFAKRGWRSQEPGAVRPDRATRFEEIVDIAIADRKTTLQKAALLAGVRSDELQERINLAMGISSDPHSDGPDVLRFPNNL